MTRTIDISEELYTVSVPLDAEKAVQVTVQMVDGDIVHPIHVHVVEPGETVPFNILPGGQLLLDDVEIPKTIDVAPSTKTYRMGPQHGPKV
jgi:hypothetical protein